MNAFDLLQDLIERGMDCRIGEDGRLHVQPSTPLTDTDRANIRANLPALKRLVSYDYAQHPEGWSQDADMPERAVHVRQGHLIDSCLFHTTEGALELIRRIALGEPLTLAFHAACAFEDAWCNAPTPFIGNADTLLRNTR